MKDGRIVEVTEVVGVEGSRVIHVFERYRPPHDTVLKRYRVACHLRQTRGFVLGGSERHLANFYSWLSLRREDALVYQLGPASSTAKG